ncbi:undecaprenyl-diphosphatase 1 [Siminovitchia terrae]|uniref:Undecaprenyl-diphosphatase n=1 Tax=Siminovitchia terrae TaxID=1914933 RepID=A0A429X5D0_SIMTE|nr:undecaprenyl-diphosphate phosphatase [Siminovitchia terrae]RST58579.1 undecaprenyl-diphosphate phosphatase [Siminovitchia terrae]GIN93257.1 undecaprenyl-diphosphatase 1 [Siminovitchia terrae]GIN96107.1 undecaprenyl-diphosphatase 1 [Siminovitchia terrae]
MELNIIEILKYIFLGLIQGITEPIPISSSGHLVLAQHFLGIETKKLTFELLVNAGSLIAVLIIYWNDIIRLAKNGIAYLKTRDEKVKPDFMFIIYLIVATIPAGVIGVLFNDIISESLKGVRITAITLLITGTALFLIRNLRGRKKDGDLTFKDAIVVGLAQAVALIPGISRSGATIVAAMGMGMKPETALRFSFLMYIPVSLGGTLLSITDMANDPDLGTLFIPYLAAFIVSIIATYFALRWFMNIMAKGNLIYFSIYCFVVGILVLIFA